MHRVLSLFLPSFPIDRIARSGRAAPDRPFATALTVAGRRLVVAASPMAARLGIAPGQPVADACALLPGLTVLAADPMDDAAALARLTEWCGRWSPWAAADGTDGVRLDVTGCAHLFGGEAGLLKDVLDRVGRLGLACRGAVADTPGAAWAVARYGGAPATVVPPGNAFAALAPLPVTALRLLPEDAATLVRLGLDCVGALAGMPRAALAVRFGDRVARRLDQALGRAGEPVAPRLPLPARWRRLAFAESITTPEDIARATAHLLDDLCRGLATAGLGARRLELDAFRVDGVVERAAVGTARPSRDPRHLARLFAEKLGTIDPGLGIDEMRLAATAADPLAPTQLALAKLPALSRAQGLGQGHTGSPHKEEGRFAPQLVWSRGEEEGREAARHGGADTDRDLPWRKRQPKRPPVGPELPRSEETSGLATLVDRLGSRLGLGNVRRLAPVASHVPERAQCRAPVFAPLLSGWPAGAPRPVRLLPHPEPVEAVAPVPDDPPVAFRWRRVGHRVIRADGPERIAGEWWRDAGGLRDYYRVEDAQGRRFWLYRAGLYDGETPARWFLHGIFQ